MRCRQPGQSNVPFTLHLRVCGCTHTNTLRVNHEWESARWVADEPGRSGDCVLRVRLRQTKRRNVRCLLHLTRWQPHTSTTHLPHLPHTPHTPHTQAHIVASTDATQFDRL